MKPHYELILFYAIGGNIGDAIRVLGYAPTTAYRWNRIYRDAGERLTSRLRDSFTMPSSGKLDQLEEKETSNLQEKQQ